ncbi:hypothetical protein [Janthinobacterium sp. CG_23.4]|nr:hypothetical protein [Janthinobacterium sp. CG_23.4]
MSMSTFNESAGVVAARGGKSTGQLMHSATYLRRPFVLTNKEIGWGRYRAKGAPGTPPNSMRTMDPANIAVTFCHLLFDQFPAEVPNFKHEMMALKSYEMGVFPLSTALQAVFDAAKPLHRVGACRFDYVGEKHGAYLLSVFDEADVEYLAAFDDELVLRSVTSSGLLVWMNA